MLKQELPSLIRFVLLTMLLLIGRYVSAASAEEVSTTKVAENRTEQICSGKEICSSVLSFFNSN